MNILYCSVSRILLCSEQVLNYHNNTFFTVLTRLSPVASFIIAEDSGASTVSRSVSKEINTMLEICFMVPTDLFLWVNTSDILALSSPV